MEFDQFEQTVHAFWGLVLSKGMLDLISIVSSIKICRFEFYLLIVLFNVIDKGTHTHLIEIFD